MSNTNILKSKTTAYTVFEHFVKHMADSDFTEQLATRIKTFREGLELSQSGLSKRMDISQSALARYETGSRQIPVRMLPDFALALELSGVDELLGVGNRDWHKPGPVPRLVEKIKRLPQKDQKFIMRLIDTTLENVEAEASV